ncbi:MAG TPA: toll/interleukin-1 receptor domain-containing protein [Steroidobacteraceae bacterium]|nr:toll/interleukin-1 receptor domain-containing protein [Steroidobacteraceae bacterium]
MARDVFVSYSVPDRVVAFEVVARLEAQGLGAWIAPRDISPACEWAEAIIDAIAAARLMVLVFSSHSNASPQVRREVERAVHKQVPVLPFRLEDVYPAKSLEYFLSSQHWLDGFPGPREPHYARLCEHVAARLAAAEAGATAAAAALPSAPAVAAAPAAAFAAEHLKPIERQLAHHIGPLAQHLVKRAALQTQDWPQLLSRLADEIDSPPARARFLADCRKLLQISS